MELMESGKKWDLAVVDPIYGDLVTQGGYMKNSSSKLAKNKNYGNSIWSQKKTGKLYFDSLFVCSTNQIIWGGNYFSSLIAKDKSCWIVWDKDNGENYFADCELAFTSFDTATRIYKYKWQGMLQQNMKNKQQRIHSTEKPIDLYRWILQKYAKAGDTILDTHGGSMSSAIACDMEGFELDICEMDKEYFDKALIRFKIYEQQQKLF
jgi:site-specific DNA-methyltransferase (adenine-specific)